MGFQQEALPGLTCEQVFWVCVGLGASGVCLVGLILAIGDFMTWLDFVF